VARIFCRSCGTRADSAVIGRAGAGLGYAGFNAVSMLFWSAVLNRCWRHAVVIHQHPAIRRHGITIRLAMDGGWDDHGGSDDSGESRDVCDLEMIPAPLEIGARDPAFFIMAFSVVRSIPRRLAAALITPPVSRNPQDMVALHFSSRVAAIFRSVARNSPKTRRLGRATGSGPYEILSLANVTGPSQFGRAFMVAARFCR
jgi:hypothetical protein